MPIKKTRVWKFFSSTKLAIWLLSIIALLSLIGTFIPQNESSAFYIDKFGHSGYGALSSAGLTKIYSSWWFVLFLTLFSMNLAACLLNRLPFKKGSAGTILSHVSILVIFLGALIGALYGQKGLIRINKAEEVSSFVSKGAKVDLGFSIRLDDFIYTEHIDPKEKLSVYPASPGEDEPPIAEVPTEIGIESDIADTGYKVKVLRYLPDFAMDITTKIAASRSAVANNPAIEVQLKSKTGKPGTFWVFARFPDMHQKMGPDFKFVYKWMGRRPKDFISRVTVLKGDKELLTREIRVNAPFGFGGYTFFQHSYDTEHLEWTALQVARDPGVPVVYAGFALLIVGLTVIFYIKPLIQRR